MILTNDEALGKKINSAVFPGLQGGPLMHVIAAKAVAFGEALRPEFKAYARQVVENARALADTLVEAGLDDRLRRHRQPPDAGRPAAQGRHRQGGRGQPRARRHHLQQERHPLRPAARRPSPRASAWARPAGTTRGFGTAEFRQIGKLIGEVVDGLAANREDNAAVEAKVRDEVLDLTTRFPIYG